MCEHLFNTVNFALRACLPALFCGAALLSGCAVEGSDCDRAIDARVACMDQAGVSYSGEDVDRARTACGALSLRADFRDFVACQEQTFLSADCPDEDAAAAAVAASESCGSPF